MTQTEATGLSPKHKASEYPAGFWAWVLTDEGDAVWREFEKLALQMAAKRSHYSAMSIVQVIRWHTALKDGTEFKINNNWAPGLARLWMNHHGNKHPDFFRMRDSLGRDVK